jgi:hypothetical protein
LIIPCEIAGKSVLPAVKAMMANELVKKHGLKQDEVAGILGISQSAVSKYTRKVRGYVLKIDDIKEVEPLIDKMVSLLVDGPYERTAFLTFFCRTCMTIRKTGLVCQFCQKTDPKIKLEKCDFCTNPNPTRK